jgi:hypothetical protein
MYIIRTEFYTNKMSCIILDTEIYNKIPIMITRYSYLLQ